jgi:hypothetical protein
MSPKTMPLMITHHPTRLHECVADDWSDEGESIFFQIFREVSRDLCMSRSILVVLPDIHDRLIIHIFPEKYIE